MNPESSVSISNRMWGVGLAATAGLAGLACSTETSVTTAPGVESATTVSFDPATPESVSTSTSMPGTTENPWGAAMSDASNDLISSILNPLGSLDQGFNQDFSCVAAAKASNGAANVITLQNEEVVEQILPRHMPPDVEFTDAFHRKWSKAISRPYLGDLTDGESVREQTKLSLCSEPVFLGTFVYEYLYDGEINGVPVYEHPDLPDFLKPLVIEGGDVNDIIAALANPFDRPNGTQQEIANLNASNAREQVAEWASAVLDLLDHSYEENVNISGNWELEQETMLNPLALPIVGPRPAYIGEEEVFTFTDKLPEECVGELQIRFNAGNGTEKGRGGDKSTRVEFDINCEPKETPPGDTTPPDDTAPDKDPTDTTPRGGSGSGGDGEDGEPNDDENGYPSTVPPTNPNSTVPATTGVATTTPQQNTIPTNPGADND